MVRCLAVSQSGVSGSSMAIRQVPSACRTDTIVPRPCSSTGLPSGPVVDSCHVAWVRARPFAFDHLDDRARHAWLHGDDGRGRRPDGVEPVDGAALGGRDDGGVDGAQGGEASRSPRPNCPATAAFNCSGFVMAVFDVCVTGIPSIVSRRRASTVWAR